jgi:hypothetical protein
MSPCQPARTATYQAYDVVYAVLPLVGRIEARVERQRDPSVPELSQKIEEPCLQPSQHEISTKMLYPAVSFLCAVVRVRVRVRVRACAVNGCRTTCVQERRSGRSRSANVTAAVAP